MPTEVASATAPSESRSLDAGTLVVWHSWTGGDGDALAAILTRFQQERPNILVETHFVAYGDLARTYTDAVKEGGGPDLILAPNWWLRELVEEDVLLPLEKRITMQERAQFIAATIDNLSWEGALYGLPTNYELVALYYNRQLLDEEELPRVSGRPDRFGSGFALPRRWYLHELLPPFLGHPRLRGQAVRRGWPRRPGTDDGGSGLSRMAVTGQ